MTPRLGWSLLRAEVDKLCPPFGWVSVFLGGVGNAWVGSSRRVTMHATSMS